METVCRDTNVIILYTWPSDFRGMEYLEGQGDLVSRLIMGIFRVTIGVIGITLLTKSP